MDNLRLHFIEEPIVVKGVIQLDEVIEQLEKIEPKRKASKDHRLWRHDMNTVIDAVNRIAGFKRYNLKK